MPEENAIENDQNSPRPNLYIFFTHSNNEAGIVGIAWHGSLCLPDHESYLKASVNEYFLDDINTAEVCNIFYLFLNYSLCISFEND